MFVWDFRERRVWCVSVPTTESSVCVTFAHLSLALQCLQQKQMAWKIWLLATNLSMGYTVLSHDVHTSLWVLKLKD